MSDPLISVAEIVPCTQAEGPGRRFALWVQGCPLRCADCCNPEMLSFDGGTTRTVADILQQIEDARSHNIEGITLIGGEPFAHAEPLSALAQQVRALDLSVMIFSGFTLPQLQASTDTSVAALLAQTDLLVDGPYDRTQPDNSRRWVGSLNQQIHFLTDRYSEEDACWSQRDTLEVRWDGHNLLVNGFPAGGATDLWRRPGESS